MADMRKMDGCAAFSEKRKLHANLFDETPDMMEEDRSISASNKRGKFELLPVENGNEKENTIISSPIIDEDMMETENDGKDEHLNLMAVDEIVEEGKVMAMVDKGKGILIEDPEEDSSDESGCDFSGAFESDAEDGLY